MSRPSDAGSSAFPETRWSRILQLRGQTEGAPELQRRLLEELCSTRWRPLYVYLRRKGLPADRAEDAVQGLLLQLIERDFLEQLDPERGRLRSYLKRALDHYLVDDWQRAEAQKRGGGVRRLRFEDVETELGAAPQDPERAYDRAWAAQVFETALTRLEAEIASGERRGAAVLVRQLFGFGEISPYAELARAHGLSVPQLKSFVFRSKARFRELVEAELRETVSSPEELRDELDYLLSCLGGNPPAAARSGPGGDSSG